MLCRAVNSQGAALWRTAARGVISTPTTGNFRLFQKAQNVFSCSRPPGDRWPGCIQSDATFVAVRNSTGTLGTLGRLFAYLITLAGPLPAMHAPIYRKFWIYIWRSLAAGGVVSGCGWLFSGATSRSAYPACSSSAPLPHAACGAYRSPLPPPPPRCRSLPHQRRWRRGHRTRQLSSPRFARTTGSSLHALLPPCRSGKATSPPHRSGCHGCGR